MSEDHHVPRAPNAQSSQDVARDDSASRPPESTDHDSKPGESGESASSAKPPKEYGGRNGPDPVRYGDWEKNGRCIDF